MQKSEKKKLKKKKRSVSSTASDKHRTRYVGLNVLPYDLWLKVRTGETVWEALKEADVELEGDCGGLGKCGKCKVNVLSSIGPPTEEEKKHLEEDELRQGTRLACRTQVDKDLVINIGEHDSSTEYFQILKSGHRPLLHPDPLIHKRLISLPSDIYHDGLSDLDRIKMVLVPKRRDLVATLHCLQELPEMLEATQFSGTAVMHDNCLLAWQHQKDVHRYYGIIFDLGTSTLVGKLINLTDGTEVAAVSRLNSQIKYGTNVISRLQYVKEHSDGLENMHNLLIKDLNRIITRLLRAGGLHPEEIFVIVAAGNTTMQHFLLTLDPSKIAEAPFTPVLTDGVIVKAGDADLRLHPDALLYVMPTKSGYIGGDLISVIIASGASEQDDEIILGMDLGTNGEIFLGNRKRIMTCSAAAGPALEGAKISHGMIARAGAIEAVNYQEGNLLYHVIGNVNPKGICGSGLVELVAVLLQFGIIDHEGLIRPNANDGGMLNSRVIEKSGIYNFLIASDTESADHRPIYLTQKDVRELQLAKGAIAGGVQTLIDEMGITAKDIKRVYLAGALGNYVNPYSATRIGMIPDIDPSIIMSIGNAASTGASMVLLSKDYWQMANDLGDFIEHVELSSRIDFSEYFVDNIEFPEENLERVDDKVFWSVRTPSY